MRDEFKPLDVLNEAIHLWWFVVLLMLIGASIGWMASFLRPPVYEAHTSLAAAIDYVQTGRLTELEHDQILEIVGDVYLSSQVIEDTVAQAASEGYQIDTEMFNEMAFRERRGEAWMARVRHKDPLAAAEIANIWTEITLESLERALKHAILADQLQHKVDLFDNCFELVTNEPSHALCNMDNLADLELEMRLTGEQLFLEKQASLGISSSLSFALIESANIPTQPLRYGRNGLIFSGATIGFVLAVWIMFNRLPGRLLRRGRTD